MSMIKKMAHSSAGTNIKFCFAIFFNLGMSLMVYVWIFYGIDFIYQILILFWCSFFRLTYLFTIRGLIKK